VPTSRDWKASMEGDIKTAAGNPNSSREETIVEGIDTPSWNTELTTVSSRILEVRR